MVNIGEEEEVHDCEIPLVGFDEQLLGSDFDFDFNIVGSCNGFLCISNPHKVSPIYLFNPITRESMTLPKSHLGLPNSASRSDSFRFDFGFGFDNFHKKFKVVRVWGKYGEIITVGEKSAWRRLKFPVQVTSFSTLLLDGILYCVEISESSVLALDIQSEKFWTIKVPSPRETRYRTSLINTDGSLAIIDYEGISPIRSIDVWLVEGSKTMGYSFNLTTYDMSGVYYPQQGLRYLGFFLLAKPGHDTFLLHLQASMEGIPGNGVLSCSLLSSTEAAICSTNLEI